MTVTFVEHEGKSKVTVRQSILESVVERDGTKQGWLEMLDRLAEEYLRINEGEETWPQEIVPPPAWRNANS